MDSLVDSTFDHNDTAKFVKPVFDGSRYDNPWPTWTNKTIREVAKFLVCKS